MTDSESAALVARWRKGDQQAAAELFQRYAGRLIALARSRLSEKFAGRVDPEDVVQSVYRSFFSEVRDDRYQIERSGDLWQLFVRITLHKLQDQVKRNLRDKRSVEREQTFGSEDSLFGIQAHVLTRDPSPIEAVALADEMEAFMRQLEPLERQVLELRLQGQDVKEIAENLRVGLRTVYRLLERLRSALERRHENA
jgi:RNA polymerase sigma-70 factor (ECF subfamily)